MSIPIVMTKAGLQPQTATALRAELIADVSATNPGYTANLPGSLIEDIASTDVAALAQCDSAMVELVNSITPYGANEFILNQLGQIYGVQRGGTTNTSVYVTFTGTPGFIVVKGFTVSDGTHQYTVSTGGILDSGGVATLFCVATTAGTWAVPADTVTQLITSVPASIGLSCNNPEDGTAGLTEESIESYRSRVLVAGMAGSQGMATYLRTLLGNVPGVESRLISIRLTGGSWQMIVGGTGDPYNIAYAIFQALFDISNLVGSATTSRNVIVTINDYPDSYNVIFVAPPLQDVELRITWDTTATNFVSETAVQELVAQAETNYINSIYCGDAINVYQLQTTFQEAIESIIPPQTISVLEFDVYIDGILTPPDVGTGLVQGDAEGYFLTTTTKISMARA